MRRTAFPGIAEAWIARGDGKQLPFAFNAKTLSTLCDIAFIGDVNPTITFAVACEIDKNNVEDFITMGASCDTSFVGDVNPIINMSIFCTIMVTS